MKTVYLICFLFPVDFLCLEATQASFRHNSSIASPKKLIQTTANLTDEPSRGSRFISWAGSLFQSAESKKIVAETQRLKDEQNAFIKVLWDVTGLPGDIIGLIGLYNQTEFNLHRGYSVCSLAVVDPGIVALGCSDGVIRLLHVDEGTWYRELRGHTGAVNALLCSPDGKELASLSTIGGNVVSRLFFDVPVDLSLALPRKIRAFSSLKKALRRDELLRIWQLWDVKDSLVYASSESEQVRSEEKQNMEKLEQQIVPLRGTHSVMDARIERAWNIHLEEVETKKLLAHVALEADRVDYYAVEKSILPKGEASCLPRSLSLTETVVGWSTGEILIIDSESPKIVQFDGRHQGSVRVLLPFFSADSKIALFRNPLLPRLSEGSKSSTLRTIDSRCEAYSFERVPMVYLVSGSDDGTVKIWNLNSKACVQTIYGHKRAVHILGFLAPCRIVSVSDVGIVRVDQLYLD